MYRDNHSASMGKGILLIGLGVLFLSGFWWPGMLFVLGAAMLVRHMSAGGAWHTSGGLWVMLFGLLFLTGFRWPLLLILLGLGMLFGGGYYGYMCGGKGHQDDDDKPKKRKHDEFGYEDGGIYEL